MATCKRITQVQAEVVMWNEILILLYLYALELLSLVKYFSTNILSANEKQLCSDEKLATFVTN